MPSLLSASWSLFGRTVRSLRSKTTAIAIPCTGINACTRKPPCHACMPFLAQFGRTGPDAQRRRRCPDANDFLRGSITIFVSGYFLLLATCSVSVPSFQCHREEQKKALLVSRHFSNCKNGTTYVYLSRHLYPCLYRRCRKLHIFFLNQSAPLLVPLPPLPQTVFVLSQ